MLFYFFRVIVDFVRSLLIISTNSGYKQMKIIQLARVSSQNIQNFVYIFHLSLLFCLLSISQHTVHH